MLAVVAVVVVVCLSVAMIEPLLNGKEKDIKATGYDLLLDDNELPPGVSFNQSKYGELFPISMNGTHMVMGDDGRTYTVSSANTIWDNGLDGNDTGLFMIQVQLYVLESIKDAHSAFFSRTDGTTPNGTLGDESIIETSMIQNPIMSIGVFREANVIVSWTASCHTDDPQSYQHYEDVLSSLLEKQCEKIKAAE